MLFLFLLGFLTSAAACPPPFNDFKYLPNDTHTTAQIIQALHPAQVSTGWTEIVTLSGYPRTVWPNGYIQYCFADETARSYYEDDIKSAWKLWEAKIGPASHENGHSLIFQEYPFKESSYPYCYNQGAGPNPTGPANWNTDVPGDIAVIGNTDTPGVQAYSIVGFVPYEWSDEPGRHGSKLSLSAKNKYPHDYWITTVAHELGHIFGFWHEHQREDRGSYVHFDCSKLENYEDAKGRVEAKGEHTIEKVCNNYYHGFIYGLDAIQAFDTIDHDEHKDGVDYPLFINTDLDFDDESIMLYGSGEFMNSNGDASDVMQVPLAYWKNRHIGFEPPSQYTKYDLELIPHQREVSHSDAEGIVHLYPWYDPV